MVAVEEFLVVVCAWVGGVSGAWAGEGSAGASPSPVAFLSALCPEAGRWAGSLSSHLQTALSECSTPHTDRRPRGVILGEPVARAWTRTAPAPGPPPLPVPRVHVRGPAGPGPSPPWRSRRSSLHGCFHGDIPPRPRSNPRRPLRGPLRKACFRTVHRPACSRAAQPGSTACRPPTQRTNAGSSIASEVHSTGAMTGLQRLGVPPGISTT